MRPRSPVGLTQEAQYRSRWKYWSTTVAGCNLPNGAISVRDAWVRRKVRGVRNRVFQARVESFELPASAQPGRGLGMDQRIVACPLFVIEF